MGPHSSVLVVSIREATTAAAATAVTATAIPTCSTPDTEENLQMTSRLHRTEYFYDFDDNDTRLV